MTKQTIGGGVFVSRICKVVGLNIAKYAEYDFPGTCQDLFGLTQALNW
jgi:hypothetical protein